MVNFISVNFSSYRIIAITTWRGLLHQRALLLFLVFALFLLAGGTLLSRFSFQEELQLFQDASLGIISFSLSIVAIVATASIFPGSESVPGLVMALTKPLPRYHYLLGKLAGLFLFLTTTGCVTSFLFFLLLFLREQSLLKAVHCFFSDGAAKNLASAFVAAPEKINYANLLKIIFLALLQSWVMASLTLLLAMIGNSMLFTILMGAASYAVGHLKGMLSVLSLSGDPLNAWSYKVLRVITSLFPNLARFDASDYMGSGIAVPSGFMLHALECGVIYIFFSFLVAALFFQRRDF